MDIYESSLTGKWGILKKFVVRGAPCVLPENMSSVHGLAEGTKGIFKSLVWDLKESKLHGAFRMELCKPSASGEHPNALVLISPKRCV